MKGLFFSCLVLKESPKILFRILLEKLCYNEQYVKKLCEDKRFYI